jgi:hypothetical protein
MVEYSTKIWSYSTLHGELKHTGWVSPKSTQAEICFREMLTDFGEIKSYQLYFFTGIPDLYY